MPVIAKGSGVRPPWLTGGSRKGKPNKVPVDLRAGVLQSFQNRGGVKWLDGLDDITFAGIFKQCLPRDVQLSGPGLEELLTGSWARDRQAQLTNGAES